MTWLLSHTIAVVLAASYLLLGVLSSAIARDLWAPYAVLTLVFAIANIVMERRDERR